MVLDVCRHVLEAAERVGTPLQPLSDAEASALTNRVRDQFFRRHLDWNYFAVETSTSGRNRRAGVWIDDYVAGRKAFLLFFDRKNIALRIPEGTALSPILLETHLFEIYLTDSEASYILVFNDHDVLIAAGDAREWLIARRERDEEEKRSKAQSET